MLDYSFYYFNSKEYYILGALRGLILIGAINRFNEWRREQREEKERQQIREESMKSEAENEEIQKPDTLGLMLNTLNQLGCQPTANDDGTLSVQYQGENFHMEFGSRYARIWDPMWAGVKGDAPDMPQIKEAVNATNFNFGPTVVMTAPDEDGDIGLHSCRDIMLHPLCPDNVPFLKAVLDSFFDTKENVRRHFEQINSQQQEKKPRRPVGFTTNTNTNE